MLVDLDLDLDLDLDQLDLNSYLENFVSYKLVELIKDLKSGRDLDSKL